jgi:hypothetical protein
MLPVLSRNVEANLSQPPTSFLTPAASPPVSSTSTSTPSSSSVQSTPALPSTSPSSAPLLVSVPLFPPVVKKLVWGEPCEEFTPVDYILASDCVYLEQCFDPLLKTLLELTDSSPRYLPHLHACVCVWCLRASLIFSLLILPSPLLPSELGFISLCLSPVITHAVSVRRSGCHTSIGERQRTASGKP